MQLPPISTEGGNSQTLTTWHQTAAQLGYSEHFNVNTNKISNLIMLETDRVPIQKGLDHPKIIQLNLEQMSLSLWQQDYKVPGVYADSIDKLMNQSKTPTVTNAISGEQTQIQAIIIILSSSLQGRKKVQASMLSKYPILNTRIDHQSISIIRIIVITITIKKNKKKQGVKRLEEKR